MRINSQNNQFVFNLPQSAITKEVEEKFQLLLDKNYIPYNDVMDYVNSTIKSIIFPGLSFNKVIQQKFHGKNKNFRESGNIMDKFQNEIDITFRSVDSHMNYFIIMEICSQFYLNNDPNFLSGVHIDMLDKDGDVIYTIKFDEMLVSSLSEIQLSYNSSEFAEHTFNLQLSYNYINVTWDISNEDEIHYSNVFDTYREHDPNDTSGLQEVMDNRKEQSYNRIGKQ